MSDVALFINGIFQTVLEEIRSTHSKSPEQTLFLQPYSASPIAMLRDNVPSPEAPVTLYASVTNDLPTITYTADIVGWENKLTMTAARRREVNGVIETLQPGEGTLYDYSQTSNPSLNLLHVRRMVKLDSPFSVASLVKTSDDKPLSTIRSRSGGWSYVRRST